MTLLTLMDKQRLEMVAGSRTSNSALGAASLVMVLVELPICESAPKCPLPILIYVFSALTFPGVPATLPNELGALTGLESLQVIGDNSIPGMLPCLVINTNSLVLSPQLERCLRHSLI